ncbi:MAG: hypothetical protein QXT77_07510 [Candidatus Methanomethylicaceae archaeon]
MAKKQSPAFDTGLVDHVFDLKPGVYALAADRDLVVVSGPDGAVLGSHCRRLSFALPEGGTVTVLCLPGTVPRIREVRMSDPVDPVPHEALLTEPRPLTLQEQIARFLGDWERRQKGDGIESFDEADDLDIDDDDNLPLSRYELPFSDDDMAPPAKPPVSLPEDSKAEPEQVPSPSPEPPSPSDS